MRPKPSPSRSQGAGATLYLAGRPGELEDAAAQGRAWRDFIYAGCDMYDVLQRALEEAK